MQDMTLEKFFDTDKGGYKRRIKSDFSSEAVHP
jgi:hypothetical protein